MNLLNRSNNLEKTYKKKIKNIEKLPEELCSIKKVLKKSVKADYQISLLFEESDEGLEEELDEIWKEEFKEIPQAKDRKRYCYLCGTQIYFSELISSNNLSEKELIECWRVEQIEFLCCSCYNLMKFYSRSNLKKMLFKLTHLLKPGTEIDIRVFLRKVTKNFFDSPLVIDPIFIFENLSKSVSSVEFEVNSSILLIKGHNFISTKSELEQIVCFLELVNATHKWSRKKLPENYNLKISSKILKRFVKRKRGRFYLKNFGKYLAWNVIHEFEEENDIRSDVEDIDTEELFEYVNEMERLQEKGVYPLHIVVDIINEVNNLNFREKICFKDLKLVKSGRYSPNLVEHYLEIIEFIQEEGEEYGFTGDDEYDAYANKVIMEGAPQIRILDDNAFMRV